MQYIDIDSTYRNRNEFPLQADFDVLTNLLPPCHPSDGVSHQTVVFPQPQTNPPVVFFEETLQQVFGSIVMKPNLPLMYVTNTPTIVQLDELVLASQDPSTRDFVQNTLYPRGSIPLDDADEAYTGMVLEDVNNAEFRKITFFNYNDTENAVFQTGVVLDTALFGNAFHLYTAVLTPVSYPMSNIDRAYQGKYLLITSGNAVGSKELIIDYVPGVNQNDFHLAAPITRTVQAGDTFQIVSDRRWFATIEQPFTTPLPLYPSYREPVPGIAIQFFQNVVYTGAPSPIEYITTASQLPIGTGVGIVVGNGNAEAGTGYPLADIFYIASADNGGTVWNTPVQVYSDVYLNRISGVRVLGSSTNSQGYGSTPTITYAGPESSFPDVQTQGAVFQQFSDDANGQFGWRPNGGTEMDTLDTVLAYTPPDKSSLIHATGSQSDIHSYIAYTNYDNADIPTLYFTYFNPTTTLLVMLTEIIDTDIAGNTIQVYDILNVTIASNPDPNQYGILYRKQWSMKYALVDIATTTGIVSLATYTLGPMYDMTVSQFFMTKSMDVNIAAIKYATGTSLMTVLPVLGRSNLSASIDASVTTIPVFTASRFLTVTTIRIDDEYILIGSINTATNEFTGCTRGAAGSVAAGHTSGTIVIGIDGETVDSVYIATTAGNTTGDTNNWSEYLLWDNPSTSSGFQGARILQHTVGGTVTTYVFAWRQNSGLQVDFSTNVATTNTLAQSTWNSPIILDPSNVTCAEVTITNNNDLLVVYGRTTNTGIHEVVSLLLNPSTLGIARPYRIRLDAPLASGSLGSLAGDGSTEIVLPLAAQTDSSVYDNTYMHIYSGYTYNTFPTSSTMFNDYRFISSYDPDTNTVTLVSDLTADPATNAVSSIVDTAVWLSFLGPTPELVQDSSGNGYNFTIVGATDIPAYATEFTDNDGITVDHVVHFTSNVDNVGLIRVIRDDTKLQDIFTWNYVYEFTPFTISLWFSPENVNNEQTLVSLTTFANPGGRTTRIYIDSGGMLRVSMPNNPDIPTFIVHNLGTVNVGTWYHLVVSCGSDQNTCNIYLNRNPVLVNGEGSRYIGFLYMISLGYWRDGIAGSTNGTEPFRGYMKDFFISAATYTQLQVDNAYYATLAQGYYTLSWEILGNLSEYYSPLNYTSPSILTSQSTCYEMELTHLTLPNAILSSGFGNRIAFYPYIYVEFSSLNAKRNNVITSNNPIAQRVLFKVPIRDTSTPDRANFVNNYSGMRQLVQFQPNDNFHFTVYMYNGDVFQTSELDSLPPLPPNPLLQISATIGFKPV